MTIILESWVYVSVSSLVQCFHDLVVQCFHVNGFMIRDEVGLI